MTARRDVQVRRLPHMFRILKTIRLVAIRCYGTNDGIGTFVPTAVLEELKPTGNAATRHELFVPNLYASLNTQLSYLLGR
jgi:hypothetical protein